MKERFGRLGRYLANDDRELVSAAAALDPGKRLLDGLLLSQLFLADYARLMKNASFAAAEMESAVKKARLHQLWRDRGDAVR